MPSYPSDVAFTPAVKAIQVEKGSRDAYARMRPLKKSRSST